MINPYTQDSTTMDVIRQIVWLSSRNKKRYEHATRIANALKEYDKTITAESVIICHERAIEQANRIPMIYIPIIGGLFIGLLIQLILHLFMS
ncbi:MAG: hypothetical protein LBD23_00280 [Oscillospiraceae bacterium]|nr:hypothetical protein [Oscillospiraceae bacterium]